MLHEWLLGLAVATPLLGAFLLPLLGRLSTWLRNVAALAFVLTSLGCVLALLPVVLGGEKVAIVHPLALGVNLFLQADLLGLFMAMVSSLVGAVIVFYSWGYVARYGHQQEYYTMVVLFLGAMMGLVFSQNLVLLYVFWEITSIASWRLIGFYREKPIVLRADKAFLVTVFGALLMLIGFVMLQTEAKSFDLPAIKAAYAGKTIPTAAVALILTGIFSKSATLPLHTWLPDAGVAPSPVTALLHAAVLVKIGVFAFARLFVGTLAIPEIWHDIVPAVAAASALLSAGAALVDNDLKRIIAFSTVSQIAFIFLGFSVGTDVGVAGALLYLLMHGLAKGGLFLCAGIVEHGTHCKDVTKLGGLLKSMPVTAVAFLLCAFSVMGIPPFGGFFAKYMVIAGAVGAGRIGISLVFVAGAVLTILYLFRIFTMVFLGEPKADAHGSLILPKEGSFVMVASVALLAALSLAGGLWINLPGALAVQTVSSMTVAVR
jgi:NADH:ubiquinone oxidoreductase subunit 5 (subunit L)/multisubunit Na+/H+ antiporter MnhA subunit